MAKHKAPTQITIASVQEKTVFHDLVERYWKLGAGLLIVGALAVLIPTYRRQQFEASHHNVWDQLRAEAGLGDGITGPVQTGSAAALASFAEENKASSVGTWAKALEVGAQVEGEKLDEAERAAQELSATWPDHLLARDALFADAGGARQTLAQRIHAGNAEIQAWEKEHAFLFANPDLPADAPRVRLNTNKGAIVVGLYVDRSPLTAQNFLELCRKGFYNGTKFHRVVRGSLIQGGDPNSVAGDPETWGKGGPETTIALENDPQLRHFKGTLAAWRGPGDTASHGSQFLITTADQNQMDGQTVVFGRVLEGMNVIEAIESSAVVGDRPQDPAIVESTEVL